MPQFADPIEVAGVRLTNRLVKAPMVTAFASAAHHGAVTDRLLRHYERFGRAKIGLIIVEATLVDWQHRSIERNLGIHDDCLLPGLSELAARTKAHGSRVLVQLLHAGAKSWAAPRLVGPSPVAVLTGAPPRQLELAELGAIKAQFAASARRARQAGFDGVELHAGHLYLLGAFLSRFTNRRHDRYGGSVANRTRFVVEVIEAVRREIGDLVISCRFDGVENLTDGIQIEEAKQIAAILEQTGVDILHVSGLRVPPRDSERLAKFSDETRPAYLQGYPDGCFIPCAAEIKKFAQIPVIGVGMVRDGTTAQRVIREELCDLIAIGRAMIADPQFADKALAGQDDTIATCQGCGRCYRRVIASKPIECSVNPDV